MDTNHILLLKLVADKAAHKALSALCDRALNSSEPCRTNSRLACAGYARRFGIIK